MIIALLSQLPCNYLRYSLTICDFKTSYTSPIFPDFYKDLTIYSDIKGRTSSEDVRE